MDSKKKAKPSTTDLVTEALGSCVDKKGISVSAILSYIMERKDTKLARLKPLVKNALEKGVSSGAFQRPKDQRTADLGTLVGRYVLAKVEAKPQPKRKKGDASTESGGGIKRKVSVAQEKAKKITSSARKRLNMSRLKTVKDTENDSTDDYEDVVDAPPPKVSKKKTKPADKKKKVVEDAADEEMELESMRSIAVGLRLQISPSGPPLAAHDESLKVAVVKPKPRSKKAVAKANEGSEDVEVDEYPLKAGSKAVAKKGKPAAKKGKVSGYSKRKDVSPDIEMDESPALLSDENEPPSGRDTYCIPAVPEIEGVGYNPPDDLNETYEVKPTKKPAKTKAAPRGRKKKVPDVVNYSSEES